MSWIEKIRSKITIRTGDGKEFQVDWRNANRSQEYNVAQFEFPSIRGTLVKRSEPKGMQYSIEFYFQGENHLDDAEDFRNSADDKRAWVLKHPLYGSINVQPTSLNYDNNTSLGFTKVTGTLIETITEDRPKTSEDPKDKINQAKVTFDDTAATAFVNNVDPEITDINQMTANNTLAYSLGKKKVKLTVDAEAYFNAFNSANAKIINATIEPLAAIREMQAVLNAPGMFIDAVENRLGILIAQFNLLRESIEGIVDPNKKRIYQTNQGSLVSSMLVAVANPQDGDYENRTQVFNTIDQVLAVYNTYIEDLDSMQTDNGGDPDSFIPDAGSMIALDSMLDFTLSNLFGIALDSKQERTIVLEDDSNLILLAHRFYGLQDDATIERFQKENEIGINEILQIRKGKRIRYYV